MHKSHPIHVKLRELLPLLALDLEHLPRRPVVLGSPLLILLLLEVPPEVRRAAGAGALVRRKGVPPAQRARVLLIPVLAAPQRHGGGGQEPGGGGGGGGQQCQAQGAGAARGKGGQHIWNHFYRSGSPAHFDFLICPV